MSASRISRPLSLPFSPMPRPWFSNSLLAYSLDVAVGFDVGHGRDDDDVARRGLAALRIIASIAAALTASITCAKSLTGCVSSGRAVRALPQRSSAAARRAEPTATSRASRIAARRTIDARSRIADPSIVDALQPFIATRPRTPRAVRRHRDTARSSWPRPTNLGDARQRDDAGDDAAGDTEAALGVPAGGRRVAGVGAFQPRDAFQQRGERRGRRDDQHRERIAAPRVSRKPSRRWSRWLRACTSHARRRSADRWRGRRTDCVRTRRVVGEDRAELERERVERALELASASSSGVASPASCQRVDVLRARSQIVARQRRRRSRACARGGGRVRRAVRVRVAPLSCAPRRGRMPSAIAAGCRRPRRDRATSV